MTRHAHITQNNKVAISLQYIKKEVSDKIGFSHVDKHRGGQTFSKCPKYKVCNGFTISSKTS